MEGPYLGTALVADEPAAPRSGLSERVGHGGGWAALSEPRKG